MKKMLAGMLALCLLMGMGMIPAKGEGQDDFLSRRMAAGAHHALAILADGSVAAAGENEDGQCNVQAWTDVIMVAAGESHSVGLKKDGTVITAGSNEYGQCDVSQWRDIVYIACGNHHTVGLKKDGTVVACGIQDYRRWEDEPGTNPCDVSAWRDVELLAAGGHTTFAVTKDRKMLAAGESADELEETEENQEAYPMDPVLPEMPRQISVYGDELLLMLYSDGTLDYRGLSQRLYPNEWMMCGVCNPGIYYWVEHKPQHSGCLWTDIVELCVSDRFIMGITKDGSVRVAGDKAAPDSGGMNLYAPEEWKDIVSMAVGRDFAMGVDRDGKMHYAYQPEGEMGGLMHWKGIEEIAANDGFALGKKADGSLIGWSAYEELHWMGDYRMESAAWPPMKKVQVDEDAVVGLDAEGKLHFAGSVYFEKEHLEAAYARGKATDIAYGFGKILILTEEGEVFFLGDVSGGLDVSNLQGAKSIWLGAENAFGLMEDGSVKIAGMHHALLSFGAWNAPKENPFTAAEEWNNIQSLALGGDVLYGLTGDGRVLLAGNAAFGQEEALDWENIVSISASPYHVAGLKKNGTAIAAGWNEPYEEEDWGDVGTKNQCEVSHWENLVQVIAVKGATIGVSKEGSVYLAGAGYADCSDCLEWKLFDGTYTRKDAPLQESSERLEVIAAMEDDRVRTAELLNFLSTDVPSLSAIRKKHPEYEKVYALHNGVAIFRKEGLYGLVDETGEELQPAVYSMIERAHGVSILHDDEADGLRFYEEKSRLLLPGIYDNADDFEGEYARVKLEGKVCYLSRRGEILSEAEYKALNLPPYVPESVGLYPFETERAHYYDPVYGYQDENGNTVIEPFFHQAYEFEDGLARIFLWGEEGVINSRGELVYGFEGMEERILEGK